MKLTYIAFPMLFLFLLGCHSATSDPNPINSTSEPSQAVKDAFGGKLFYQNATPEELTKCDELGLQCARENITQSHFCGLDALVFLRFESESTYVPACIIGTSVEFMEHYKQTPEIKYVFYGNLRKGEKPELIHGNYNRIMIRNNEYALVGLIEDHGKWFIANTVIVGVNGEVTKLPQPQDGFIVYNYNDIPTEPKDMETYFKAPHDNPAKFCSPEEIQDFRNDVLQSYKNPSTESSCTVP